MHIRRLLAALLACFAPSFAAQAEPAFDILELPSPGRTSAAGFADLDGDGHTDIYAVSLVGIPPAERRELRIHFQQAGGTLSRTPDWTGAVLDGAAAFDVADFPDGPGEELLLLRRHRVTVLSFAGRRVVVVDGTGLTAPDTKANQKRWPQQSQQKPGCGFASLRVCACFSLKTGAILSYEIGNKKSHELRLFRKQWDDLFQEGDINLGDKMFSNYFDFAMLSRRGIDSVATQAAAKRKPIKARNAIEKLGDNDLLVVWNKPVWNKKAAYTREDWEALPDTLTLRQIKVFIEAKGFRTKSFYIVTTLLDPIEYPAAELAELYLRRWEVELNFDDLKTTMGMDELRCKTPEMVEKELLMHFIVYNAARWMICNAAKKSDTDLMRISFKGALQELRNWEGQLNHPKLTQQDKRKLIAELYRGIGMKIVPLRPNRREPRCLKRRPKPYQLLTEHRSTMKEIKHRSKYRAKAA